MTDRRQAIDLASGKRVTLVVSAVQPRDAQLAWASRCAGRDDLLDYGLAGCHQRFEAWSEFRFHPIEQRIASALGELFEDVRRPQVLRIFGPAGSGKTSLLMRLARCARLHGFVPIAIDLLDSPLAGAVEGRPAFLIDDERDGRLRALADLVLRSSKPHVLIQASQEDVRGVPGIGLPQRRRSMTRDVAIISRAAERAPVYGAATTIPWPVPAEVLALRRQADEAIRHLVDGRHAPGERRLREAVGGLSRRGEWASAAEGWLALAESLLKRGRARDARAIVEGAREACRKASGDRLLISAATLSGVALVDLGRLDEAETVLSAALTVAAHADDRRALAAVALALARCRFWRGQYADGRDALRVLLDRELEDDLRVRLDVMRARLAVGEGDVAGAIGLCTGASERAARTDTPAIVAEAAYGAAVAHLAAGDLAAVRLDVATCRIAARAARDPLRLFRAQLMLCEQLRRSGARDEALKAFVRARRVPASALPRLLKSRRDMMAELLAPDAHVADIVARHVAATGCHALALFVPSIARPERAHGAPSTPVDDAIEMMRVCQTASDEATTLALVCEQVQRQTQAAAVGCLGVEPGGLTRLSSRGPRLELGTAERAIDANVFIAPHHVEERVEAAMPVLYGGHVIGALALRWLVSASPDVERVSAVVSMAAAAAAPVIAAALSARRRADASTGSELLGLSESIAEVRKAVERASAAPFSVLIEGESGSGKELVARAIHKGGVRRDRPFVTLNCAALPDDLVESELFGHARGAFTGAVGERAGVFEEAHTGTLFLDEVGELSPRAQAKILRVIQEGELRRVGENLSRRVDVRLVSATNRDLRAEAAAGRFRLDLLYRLDVIRITVPPLRDRRDDIPVLIDQIWRDASTRFGSQATLGAPIIATLTRYEWPGNVRELQNVLASLVVRVGKRGVVPVAALPPAFIDRPPADACRLDQARLAFDANFVRAALVRCGGRRSLAANELGLTRQGLAKLMVRLGIGDAALS